MKNPTRKGELWSWWYLLFLVQFLLVLYPPLFNKLAPTLFGVPFFYWFQLLCVFVAAVLNAVVYCVTRES